MINSVNMGSMAQMMPPKMPSMSKSSAEAAQSFIEKADTNSDGMVDKSELSSLFQSQIGVNDDNISADEIAEKMLADFDASGDGTITQDEFESAINALAESMRQERQGMMPPPPPKGHDPMDVASIFADADNDENGGLDETEFTAMLQSGPMGSNATSEMASTMFAEADLDDDGILTQNELKTAMEANRKHGHAQAEDETSGYNLTDMSTEQLNPLIAQLLKHYQDDYQNSSTGISVTA